MRTSLCMLSYHLNVNLLNFIKLFTMLNNREDPLPEGHRMRTGLYVE